MLQKRACHGHHLQAPGQAGLQTHLSEAAWLLCGARRSAPDGPAADTASALLLHSCCDTLWSSSGTRAPLRASRGSLRSRTTPSSCLWTSKLSGGLTTMAGAVLYRGVQSNSEKPGSACPPDAHSRLPSKMGDMVVGGLLWFGY